MEYLLEYNYDNDCVYIFNNLPKEANDEQIKVNDQKLKQLDVMIDLEQYINKLDNDIYLLEHQLENKRE